jgi:hypothetical protein
VSGPGDSVAYKDGDFWIGHRILHSPLTILNYNLLYDALVNSHLNSIQRYRYFTTTVTCTESSWSAVLHQHSGTGFQRRASPLWAPELSPRHKRSD